MTLTAIVGALLAVIARPQPEDPWERLEKVVKRVDQLTRSQAQLIDHIKRLERELAVEKSMVAHWKGEAQRMARQSREAAEAWRRAAQERHDRLARLQQANHEAEAYAGWCNCVPSRAQVWGSQNGLVRALNRGEA